MPDAGVATPVGRDKERVVAVPPGKLSVNDLGAARISPAAEHAEGRPRVTRAVHASLVTSDVQSLPLSLELGREPERPGCAHRPVHARQNAGTVHAD